MSTVAKSDQEKYVASQRAFTKCLRAAGIDAPDPDAKGEVNMTPAPGQPAIKTLPGFAKCTDLRLPEPVRTLSAKDLAFDRTYAKCMRDNGVPDYPDPLTTTDYASPEAKSRDALKDRLFKTPAWKHAAPVCEPHSSTPAQG